MAWEELLRLHETEKESQSLQEYETAQDSSGSLIRRVCEMFGQNAAEDGAAADDGAPPETVRCADGYVRRSPVQPYTTAKDFFRRRVRRIIMILVVLVLAVLLIIALMRAGLLVFRLR